MKPNFIGRATNIIAAIHTSTCIDDVDVEVIKDILQAELNEYYRMLDEYYEAEYYNAISSASSSAYDDGYSVGYDDGYLDGHSEV